MTEEAPTITMEPVDEKLCDTKHAAIEKLVDKLSVDGDKRCDLIIQKIETRLHGMDIAVNLKTVDLEKRLAALNELRSEVIKDRSLLVPKNVYDTKTDYYDRWITTANDRLTTLETRLMTWGAAISVFFVLVQIALHFFGVGK